MGQFLSSLTQFFDNITCRDACLSSCCSKTVIIEEIVDEKNHRHCNHSVIPEIQVSSSLS